jgi:glycosyltransferase involved in cell wall biosynthesis
MSILLSAYACEPNRGSEPGVGWNMAVAIAKHQPTWVLTSNTHRPAIEQELAAHPIPNLQVVYVDPLGWVYDWSQEGKRAHWDVHLHYYLWQIWAYFTATKLHAQVGFKVAHHVTYVKYSSPSFLSLLPVPFIWGPIGGAESAPYAFWRDFDGRGKLYETLRAFARWLGELDVFVHLTARRSALTWTTTKDTAKAVQRLGANQVEILIESGLSQDEINRLAQFPVSNPPQIRFISMGRLLHWKGFSLGIRAFAKAACPNAEYWILGEGPERTRLQVLTEELGVADRVKFLGRLSRDEGLQQLGECQVLIHPSLHDSGGWVCLEAMAAGRPVICLDLGGPGAQVTPQAGVKVPALHPDQAVSDMAEAILKLAQHPELREQMAAAGRKLVSERYSWDMKALQVNRLYTTLSQQLQMEPLRNS